MSEEQNENALPLTLTEALDSIERDIHSLPVARLLKRRNLSVESARSAVRGLKSYLNGEIEEAAQVFEALADDLRDQTVTIGG